jgi:hypothetical protein
VTEKKPAGGAFGCTRAGGLLGLARNKIVIFAAVEANGDEIGDWQW